MIKEFDKHNLAIFLNNLKSEKNNLFFYFLELLRITPTKRRTWRTVKICVMSEINHILVLIISLLIGLEIKIINDNETLKINPVMIFWISTKQ